MARTKFLRRNTGQYSRLGKKRKKLQKWSAPKGRDNKMRLKEKGYPRVVSVGYKKDARMRGKINGKEIIRVENPADINKASRDKLVLIGKIGKRKRAEIEKIAKEKGIMILNLKKTKEKTKEKKWINN